MYCRCSISLFISLLHIQLLKKYIAVEHTTECLIFVHLEQNYTFTKNISIVQNDICIRRRLDYYNNEDLRKLE